MKKNTILTLGIKQISRKEARLFCISEVEGLIDILDNNFDIWSDFDSWESIAAQQWMFLRAMEVKKGRKIDIKCHCCEYSELRQSDLDNIKYQKCYGLKSVYIIKKVLFEIIQAEAKRKTDGTYSA